MTADSIGGVWTYALDLSQALSHRGVEVVLAVMGRPLTREQQRDAASISTLTVREKPYKLEWMDEPWVDVDQACRWLLELERDCAPDVVQLNGYSYASASFRSPTVVVAHSCVLSWWKAVKEVEAPNTWDVYRERVRKGIHAARSVIAPTKDMLSVLQAHYGSFDHGEVIENGCDLSRYAPDMKEPFVFSAGRVWDEAKDLRLLAQLAAKLPWDVYVAGDAQRPRGVSAGAPSPEYLGVKLLGQLARTDMAAWLGRAAIYAHPARYEPFGLTVLEAAASGCALVLSDIGSLRELWDGAALFVKPSDPDAWQSALTNLMHDGPLRQQLASAALGRAGNYDLVRFGDAYAKHYQTQLGPYESQEREQAWS
jgi:glycosyltransferase involved in cell wall biosynthesis